MKANEGWLGARSPSSELGDAMVMGFRQAATGWQDQHRCLPCQRSILDPPIGLTSAAEVAEQLDLAPDVRSWHIASFRCAVEFGHYRGIAGFANPSTSSPGVTAADFSGPARARWRSTVPPSWEAGRSAP